MHREVALIQVKEPENLLRRKRTRLELHGAAGDPSRHETDNIHRPGREGTLDKPCIYWRLEVLSVSIGLAT